MHIMCSMSATSLVVLFGITKVSNIHTWKEDLFSGFQTEVMSHKPNLKHVNVVNMP